MSTAPQGQFEPKIVSDGSHGAVVTWYDNQNGSNRVFVHRVLAYRNAAKAVYFELDVNLATITVAREHGLFVDLDRSAFERLLPELATLLDAPALKTVVDAYMTHAGYRQLASRDDLPAEVRSAALGTYAAVHRSARTTLRASAFSEAERRAIAASLPQTAVGAGDAPARAKS